MAATIDPEALMHFVQEEHLKRSEYAKAEAARRGAAEDEFRRSQGDAPGESRPSDAPDPKAAPDEPKADAPKTADAPKSDAAEPKPQPKSDTPKTDPPKQEPKPSPKPAPAPAAAAGDGKRAWNAGRIGTQIGVPPSAVRNLKAGEPVAGIKGLAKAQWNAGQHWSGKGAEKLGSKLSEKGLQGVGKNALKTAGRLLPGVGSLYAGYSAYKDFESGDYVGMALNVLGVIPGPVGWVALGAATIWDAAGWGHTTYGEWDQPDGTATFMLPGAAKDVANVKEVDAAITKAQRGVFRFQDGPTGTVWSANPPAALRIDGKAAPAVPGTGSGVSGIALAAFNSIVPGTGRDSADGSIQQLVTDYLGGLSDLFEQIDKAMMSANEPYFTEQRQALQPHLAAMAQLKTQIQPLLAQLTAVSDAAGTAYQSVLDANHAARKQLSDSGTLTDQGPATTMVTAVETSSSQVATANSRIGQLFSETPPPVVMVRGTTAPTGIRPAETKPPAVAPAPAVTPAAVTPQTPAGPAKVETPAKNTADDLTKLLSQLGKQNTPTATNPLPSTGTGGLGGGSPLGGQGLGGGQGGGTPLAASKPDTSAKEEPKKLVDSSSRPERKTAEKKLDDTKSLSTPKPEQQMSAVPAPEAKPAPVAAAPVATPAPAAPTPAQQNAAHAAAAQEPSKEVDVKGTKTTFPDAKTAKMAELLSKADPTHPMSLADAAKQAGLTPPTPGQDPGTQVAPTDAKPGDLLVAGGKNFMLLGDGKFYDLNDYKVVGASEIPQQLGERAGYFHLVDPSPGSPAGQGVTGPQTPPAAPQGPVSPQSTAGVQFPVPGATAAPTGPVDAGAPPAAPGGVPVAGTPGVPKPGVPGSGPANAASTDTGTGVGGVSTGGQKLDPAAVR
ncbi:Uncharacterised protein [Mycobacteroides abscessus subsp. abscessus]|uniref:hypothetical protein n=1 Tax=Mycobacteroides abscessus TaxID=36809 RepID=UPI00092BE420|nr:hypothetical protein [Mycobacteroides abscessus]SHR99059.1 Uncharacterised protein [Mycobacteroides abscessus subsp. abscessus]